MRNAVQLGKNGASFRNGKRLFLGSFFWKNLLALFLMGRVYIHYCGNGYVLDQQNPGHPSGRLREQARSHRGTWVTTGFVFTADQMWEQACSRWHQHKQRFNLWTADKHAHPAASHPPAKTSSSLPVHPVPARPPAARHPPAAAAPHHPRQRTVGQAFHPGCNPG